jgi:dihydrolipoamide dehydrogenase
MSIEFKLPEVSEGVESADVAEILVAEGDDISAGQVVMEIETEKAVVELPCPHAGRVEKVHVSSGDTVEVGSLLLTIAESAEAKKEAPKEKEPPKPKEEKKTAAKKEEAPKPKPVEKKPEPKKPAPAAKGGNGKPLKVVVLGGGPGGYPAAFEAADHGMEVTLVDDDVKPGGVCLHRGCIPSKALLHIAKLIHEAREAAEWGLSFGEPKIDLDKLRNFKSGVVGKLTGGIEQLGKLRGVTMLRGRGSFIDSNTLKVDLHEGGSKELGFDKCIIATGSSPAMPAVFNIGDERVMDSSGALDLPDVPKTLLVVGGGYIGLEMGSVYAALGSKVTVVEMLSGLLPGADRDLVRPLHQRLKEQFEAIYLKTKIQSLKATDKGIVAKMEGEEAPSEQTFDRVLIAIGRRPNSKGFGLENTRAEVDESGFIKVNRKLQTMDPNLLAIGDVAGEPMLAHKATREAKVAVEALAGEPAEFDNVAIPAVVFTDPELAWCGLTENEAKAEGREVQIVRFPWGASGRAQTLDRTEGLTKMLIDPETQRVLGMGIVGPGAGELIAEGVLAVEMAAVARDVAESIHAHPTLSETIMESAEAAFGQATHMHRPPKKKA